MAQGEGQALNPARWHASVLGHNPLTGRLAARFYHG